MPRSTPVGVPTVSKAISDRIELSMSWLRNIMKASYTSYMRDKGGVGTFKKILETKTAIVRDREQHRPQQHPAPLVPPPVDMDHDDL